MTRMAVKIDRVVVTSKAALASPPALDGYTVIRNCFVRQQTTKPTYARSTTYWSLVDETKIYWKYQPLQSWLRPWKITIIADDRKGLSYEELSNVLRYCRGYHLLAVEVAVDFSPEVGINRRFVRVHGVFGKCRQQRKKDDRLCYGSRKADKFVRCYHKRKLGVFRVEPELHGGLLRRNSIFTLDDFVHLPQVLYPKHLQFVDIEWNTLKHYLTRSLGDDGRQVYIEARDRATSLRGVRRYLKRKGIVNFHRFLTPRALNVEIKRALENWGKNFKKETS